MIAKKINVYNRLSGERFACIKEEIKMNRNKKLRMLGVLIVFMISPATAENIDPYEDNSQYAYSENIGWLNFEPAAGDGAQVESDKLTGWVWAENIGWISLSCENTSSCATVNYGITNDGNGNLAGFAWAENVGWISFSCDNTSSCSTVDYGVTIDEQGNFNGWAWSENVGWIHFNSASPVAYKVQACKVSLDDLANFVNSWLETGFGIPADFDDSNDVDFGDYSILADYWRDYCPDSWPLK